MPKDRVFLHGTFVLAYYSGRWILRNDFPVFHFFLSIFSSYSLFSLHLWSFISTFPPLHNFSSLFIIVPILEMQFSHICGVKTYMVHQPCYDKLVLYLYFAIHFKCQTSHGNNLSIFHKIGVCILHSLDPTCVRFHWIVIVVVCFKCMKWDLYLMFVIKILFWLNIFVENICY